ncbi:MAG: D-alanyl-D-alanine carboxypeptidase [Alphaproteobacteria bacterium]
MRLPRLARDLRSLLGALSLILLSAAAAAGAAPMETSAKQAYIVDFETGSVLLDKNSDQLMAPSSMSKLMTVYMVFERLKEGTLSLDDQFTVSERAWRTGGSKMFVPLNGRVKVEDLLRGIIIQSGNDACVVVAEGLAQSEEAFSAEMTKKATKIGLQHSTLRNATGLPAPDHLMTARDLAILAKRIIADFPQYYPIFKELNFTYNNIKQGNRNPLLYQPATGGDGLKTGHTEGAGYGLTASAIRDGRRLIMVLNGMESMKIRTQESERLIDWAFRDFENVRLFDGGEVVTTAEVWLGGQPSVSLVAEKRILATLPRTAIKDIKVAAVFDGPVPAPIRKGERIATLTINAPGIPATQVPLVAGEDVDRLGFVGRLFAAAKHILWGFAN